MHASRPSCILLPHPLFSCMEPFPCAEPIRKSISPRHPFFPLRETGAGWKGRRGAPIDSRADALLLLLGASLAFVPVRWRRRKSQMGKGFAIAQNYFAPRKTLQSPKLLKHLQFLVYFSKCRLILPSTQGGSWKAPSIAYFRYTNVHMYTGSTRYRRLLEKRGREKGEGKFSPWALNGWKGREAT